MKAPDDEKTGTDDLPDTPSSTSTQGSDSGAVLMSEILGDRALPTSEPNSTPLTTASSSTPDDVKDDSTIDVSTYGNFPGFDRVVDPNNGMFNSKSDFEIFVDHIGSEIPLQRLVAVKQLAQNCRRFGFRATKEVVIPKLSVVANDKEMVIRQTCADQIGPFCEYLIEASDDSPEAHNLIICELMHYVQGHLLDAMEVRQAAGRSLVIIAGLLTQEEVYEHVLKIVLDMAHDDSDDHKITALPLIGDLASIVGPAVCANYLSQDLSALSQDNSFRVRKATVQYFGPICEQLGPAETERRLLPIFKTLATDSIWSVRKGCVESLVDVAKAVSEDTRKGLIDIMSEFLTDMSRWVRNAAYEVLGPFIATLTSEQIGPDFLAYYTKIPQLKSSEADTESCNHCAFNFPAVVLTLGKDRWDELHNTYNVLVRKTFKTRKTLACSLHEIANILGTELTEKHLLPALDIFLKDIDEIRYGVVQNFAKFLKVLSTAKREEHLTTLWELAAESDSNWRFRLILARQLDILIELYPPRLVHEQLVPLTFQLCDDKMVNVRLEAIKHIGKLINTLQKAQKSSWSEDVLKKCAMLAKNRTYTKRQLFIHMCRHCVDTVTPAFFKTYFLTDFVNTREDNVSNVRLCLAKCVAEKFENHEVFGKDPEIEFTIKMLRDDPDDVDIVRYFRSPDEVQEYQRQLEQRRRQLEEKELDDIMRSDSDDDSNVISDGASDAEGSSSSAEYQPISPRDKPKTGGPDKPDASPDAASQSQSSSSSSSPSQPGGNPQTTGRPPPPTATSPASTSAPADEGGDATHV